MYQSYESIRLYPLYTKTINQGKSFTSYRYMTKHTIFINMKYLYVSSSSRRINALIFKLATVHLEIEKKKNHTHTN